MIPASADISAVGNEAGLGAPTAGAGLPIGISFNSFLLHRIEGRESHEVFHVSAGGSQNEFQSGVVNSGDSQVVGIALEAGEHVSIVGRGLVAGSALPGVLEVSCSQIAAVGPLQALAQGNGVGQAVFADFIAGRAGRSGDTVGIVGVQAGEGVGSQAGAVDRAVQSRVEVIRLGREVQTERVGAVVHLGVHEELGGKRVGVDAGNIVLLQIDVVVVVDGDDTAGGHEDVLSLVHHLGALGIIGLSLDRADQLVILGPVSQRIDESIADEGSGIGDLFRDSLFFSRCFLCRCGGCCWSGGGRAAAGTQCKHHHQSKKHCKNLLHFVFPFEKFFIFKIYGHPYRLNRIRGGISDSSRQQSARRRGR